MEQIARDSRRTFYLHALEPEGELPLALKGAPCAALVWATRATSHAHKLRIAYALVTAGCRNVAFGGVESEAWADAADDAYLAQELPDPVPQDRFVATSSHRGEQPDDVVFYLAQATRDSGLSRYVVLLVGPDPAAREALVQAVREEAAAWG